MISRATFLIAWKAGLRASPAALTIGSTMAWIGPGLAVRVVFKPSIAVPRTVFSAVNKTGFRALTMVPAGMFTGGSNGGLMLRSVAVMVGSPAPVTPVNCASVPVMLIEVFALATPPTKSTLAAKSMVSFKLFSRASFRPVFSFSITASATSATPLTRASTILSSSTSVFGGKPFRSFAPPVAL